MVGGWLVPVGQVGHPPVQSAWHQLFSGERVGHRPLQSAWYQLCYGEQVGRCLVEWRMIYFGLSS